VATAKTDPAVESYTELNEFNKLGTLRVLEFVRKNKCKLIYAGSSTKFGDNGQNANESPYAWSKSSNTQLVINYGRWFNIDFAITYFYNVYGPREIRSGKYATLTALFNEKKQQNLPLTVVSPGTQERNFTHVYDTVDALVLIGEKGCGDEYGIGNPKTYSVLDVAKIFCGEIKMLPARRGNRMVASVVSEKTKMLGWEPKKCLEEYICGFLNSYK
jgi:UDP-glucose 4-epimerase